MRLLNLALCAALIAPNFAAANELLRVYDLAAQNDTQLRAAAGARDAGREATRQTGGALLPQVTGNASASQQRNKITFTVDRDPVTNAPITPMDVTTSSTGKPYSLSVNLNQALFNAELWDRWRQAGDRVALSEVAYRSTEQDLALRLTETYFSVLGAADNVRFANAQNKAIERQLELAKKRFEVGLSAITDVQEAQAGYDLTVADTIEAEQALASAREALAEITGPAQLAIQPLKEEIPLQGPDPDSVNDWLKAAAESNLTLRSAQLQSEIAGRGVSISRAGHYPTLSLAGQQAIGERDDGFNQGEFESNSISLQLNVPIFSGGITQANVRASRSIHEQRLAELEGTRRQVERRTRDAYQGVIAGVSRIKARKQAVLSNATALEAAEVGLEVGSRTAVDVLNAQQVLYSTQRNYARARYDYLLNILRLKSAAGQLSQRDLIEIDALLITGSGSEVAGHN